MSGNNHRKCAKCGRTRAEEDMTVTYHRFPNPGTTNITRARVWAKYCWPNEDWTSVELLHSLYTKNKVLCGRHFNSTQFYDNERQKLSKFAVPESTVVEELLNEKENIFHKNVEQSSVAAAQLKLRVPLLEIENIVVEPCTSAVSSIQQTLVDVPRTTGFIDSVQNALITEKLNMAICSKSNLVKKRTKILATLGVTKVSQMTPREIKLYKICRNKMHEIIRLRNKIKNIKRGKIERVLEDQYVQELCNLNISNSFITLLQSQLQNCPKKPKGRRYTLKQKIQALLIYKKSPAFYRLLRRMFALLCQTSLNQLLNKVPLKPGINKHIFTSLEKMSQNHDKEDNICILSFDEMSIRRHLYYNQKLDEIQGFQDHGDHGRTEDIASKALVFMLTGLRKKWKQPIAFYFSHTIKADRMTIILKEILTQCIAANINVVATVCDLSTVNLKVLKTLGATSTASFFNFCGQEIVSILDPPHLLKCTRNLLMKHDIEVTSDFQCNEKPVKGTVKWSHIEAFYQLDKTNPNLVYAPQLTDNHLRPNCQQKMRVKLAAQVFSFSVTTGMLMKIAQNELPAEAHVTATFVQKFDELFDAVNADSPDLRRGKKYSTNLNKKTPHLFLFKDMRKFISNMKYIGSKSNPPSQEGWIHTLNAMERLWKNLQAIGIKSLPTRRLNQDPLENCFGCIRYSCGSNNNPTINQFIAGIKTAIISNLKHSGHKRNCEDDTAIISNNLSNFLTANISPIVKSPTFKFVDNEEMESLLFDAVEAVEQGTSESQACGYVCGFIFKKLRHSNCLDCRRAFLSDTQEIIHMFTSFKEYDPAQNSLNYVDKDMVTCVEMMANIINKYLKTNAYRIEIKINIFSALECVDFSFLNKCIDHLVLNENHLKVSTFFIITKRYCVLRNRDMDDEEKKKALERKMRI